jgi:hypothetical protein
VSKVCLPPVKRVTGPEIRARPGRRFGKTDAFRRMNQKPGCLIETARAGFCWLSNWPGRWLKHSGRRSSSVFASGSLRPSHANQNQNLRRSHPEFHRVFAAALPHCPGPPCPASFCVKQFVANWFSVAAYAHRRPMVGEYIVAADQCLKRSASKGPVYERAPKSDR